MGGGIRRGGVRLACGVRAWKLGDWGGARGLFVRCILSTTGRAPCTCCPTPSHVFVFSLLGILYRFSNYLCGPLRPCSLPVLGLHR